MSYETLIHEMLDDFEAAFIASGGRGAVGPSKHSIVERYFKKVHEDTKKKCIAKIDEIDDGEAPEYRHCQEEIRKL